MSLTSKLLSWARRKSPWIIHFNSGACNACDIEIIAALTPRYDIERFGIQLKATPRHADVLVCSGPVTRQIQDRIVRIYEQMAEPKFVVACRHLRLLRRRFPGLLQRRGRASTPCIPVSAPTFPAARPARRRSSTASSSCCRPSRRGSVQPSRSSSTMIRRNDDELEEAANG